MGRFTNPRDLYFGEGARHEVKNLKGKKAIIVSGGSSMRRGGFLQDVEADLKEGGFEVKLFEGVESDPSIETVMKGAEAMRAFEPDVIIALGGGSPMDAAKIMWVMYEHPETHFEELALRFMDIRKRIYKFPKMGVKAKMVAITTTSGTGSEVTPFAVVTDDATGQKYPLADYALTPDMAIVDANLVMDMPKSLCAFGGLDAVTHALEAYVSVLASEFSDGQALQALKLLKEYLPASYHEGSKNPVARERVHSAATIAGIAFANAFLGVCHSMAHKLGSQFHIPHGLANALLICNVIRYNANDNPTKQTAFSQYDRPQARRRYAEIADHLGLSAPGDRTAAKIEKLLAWLESIKAELGIPKSIREAGVQEADFLAHVDKLSEDAFDDQCTGANPRYPLISELKQILLDTYYGREFVEGEAGAKAEVAPVKAEKKAKKSA